MSLDPLLSNLDLCRIILSSCDVFINAYGVSSAYSMSLISTLPKHKLYKQYALHFFAWIIKGKTACHGLHFDFVFCWQI